MANKKISALDNNTTYSITETYLAIVDENDTTQAASGSNFKSLKNDFTGDVSVNNIKLSTFTDNQAILLGDIPPSLATGLDQIIIGKGSYLNNDGLGAFGDFGMILIGNNSANRAAASLGYESIIIGHNTLNKTASTQAYRQSVFVGSDILATTSDARAESTVAIGFEALERAVRALSGVYVGRAAGSYGDSEECVMIGAYAGYGTSSSLRDDAVYIGYRSGYAATGHKTTYIGRESGEYVSGENNVAIGWQALQSSSSSGNMIDNVAVGQRALTLVEGDSNVALGNYAGGLLTTGDNNIIIGSVTSDIPTTMSDTLVIGRDSKIRIFADDNGLAIGGNNITPTEALDVTGTVTANKYIVEDYASLNFGDDTAAAAGGVPLGGLYHDAGVARIRIS